MIGRIPARVASVAAALLACSALAAVTASVASAKVVYDSIPKVLPPNFASIGFEATSTSELGGEIELTSASAKKAQNLTVTAVMSSWACQSGGAYSDDCTTTPGATFAWPITLKLYSVGAGGEPVGPIAQETQTFNIPYRPSASPQCRGELAGTWWSTQGHGKHVTHACVNGIASAISFEPVRVAAPVPKQLIVSLAYNTESYGAEPTHVEGPENSLNVALSESWEATLSRGADPSEGIYVNSGWNEMYCGSSSSLHTFSFAGTCWGSEGGYQPVLKVTG